MADAVQALVPGLCEDWDCVYHLTISPISTSHHLTISPSHHLTISSSHHLIIHHLTPWRHMGWHSVRGAIGLIILIVLIVVIHLIGETQQKGEERPPSQTASRPRRAS